MATSRFSRLQSFLNPPLIIGVVLIIAVGASIFTYFYVNETPSSQYSPVTQGSITQTVTASGMVTPTESVNLGFEISGTIGTLPIVVGQSVSQGEVLATLQNANLTAESEQAQANVQAAQAQLSSLEEGTRPDVLATDRAAVAQAIEAGSLAVNDALYNRADVFFINPESSTPTIDFSMSDAQLESNLISGRVSVQSAITGLQSLIPEGNVASTTSLVGTAGEAEQDLVAVLQFLDTANSALAEAVPSASISAATIATWQSSVTTAGSEVSDALQALTAAQGTLSVAEAGSSSQDIAAQQAAVAAAQAALNVANANLAQTVLTAPIGGTITEQSGNIGEVVSQGETFITLNSNARFEVDVYVSEVDLAELAVGNPVSVTLDAYPGVTFPASIVAIDPAATVQNGISTYKVTAQFTTNDPRIKAGLTANLSITTAEATSTLLVPTSALITQATSTYVLLLENTTQVLTPVTTGIESQGGETQILSGLSEGEQVVSFGGAAPAGTSQSQ